MGSSQQDLINAIDALLPQTQCQRCGYPACRLYAEAIAQSGEAINRCPPGGSAGIEKLARLTGQAVLSLNEECGMEAPLRVALIDESRCIGCALCPPACPTDAIVGAFKLMHAVVEMHCTGCELCLPTCPVDCISMVAPEPAREWTEADANASRSRFERRQTRRAKEAQAAPAGVQKKELLEQALAKAQARRASATKQAGC